MVSDEFRGTNLLLIATEDFSSVDVRRVGPVEPEYGFSAIRKIPGTNGLFVAIKVREVDGETHSKLAVFDLDGKFYLDSGFEEIGEAKFEGLEFLQDQGFVGL